MPKMATFRPPGAEKLIFSDKTLPCSIDCAPKRIGQCTHCRGGAESVLTLSATVIGVGLHRLGANLTLRLVGLQLVRNWTSAQVGEDKHQLPLDLT